MSNAEKNYVSINLPILKKKKILIQTDTNKEMQCL